MGGWGCFFLCVGGILAEIVRVAIVLDWSVVVSECAYFPVVVACSVCIV